jgi:hypothetical protein
MHYERKAFDSHFAGLQFNVCHMVFLIETYWIAAAVEFFPPAAAILGSSIATAVVNNNCVRLRLLTKEHE